MTATLRLTVLCLAPAFASFTLNPAIAAEPRFTDVTAASGLKAGDNTAVGGTNPHAVAVEDFDGDGLYDIVIATFGAPHVRYFRNRGELKFTDVTAGCGLESFSGEGTGAAVADFDRDGKLDLYLSSLRNGASRLYRGRGDGRFDDVTERAGMLVQAASRSCAWSDVDGDGYVDLYVTCPKGPNRLYRNRRDGTFEEIAEKAGVALADRHSLGCAFGDVDGDGRDDLFVANYESQQSAMFRSLGGGRFVEITAEAGLARKASAVGCAFADVFNRGRLDLYVTTDSWLSGANSTEPQLLQQGHTVEPNVLYRAGMNAHFAVEPGPPSQHKTLSHDVTIEDLDHDGRCEIYLGVDAIPTGNIYATSKGGNPLWTRTADGSWCEVGREWGVAFEGNCVCVPVADFDNDGDLDLLLVNFYENLVLYRNNTNDRRWLRVRTVGAKSNVDGIGSLLSLFALENGKRRLLASRQISSGTGYCRCSPLEAHFGLGSEAGPFEVEVRFPSGRRQVFAAAAGQRMLLHEESGP